jgi:hypothetical protein
MDQQVTAEVSGLQVTILRDGVSVLGVDLEGGTVGHWPDGETWVQLLDLPPRLPPGAALTPDVLRIGTPHEEDVIGGRGYCRMCGWIDEADPEDPTVRRYHGDSFEYDDPDEEDLVLCRFCGRQVPASTAHLYQGGWVGDDCCWDERLRSSQ